MQLVSPINYRNFLNSISSPKTTKIKTNVSIHAIRQYCVALFIYAKSILSIYLVDLESQIQDLHVSNETASAEVLRLDQENQMLTAHIKRLSENVEQGAQAERDHLLKQVSSLPHWYFSTSRIQEHSDNFCNHSIC